MSKLERQLAGKKGDEGGVEKKPSLNIPEKVLIPKEELLTPDQVREYIRVLNVNLPPGVEAIDRYPNSGPDAKSYPRSLGDISIDLKYRNPDDATPGAEPRYRPSGIAILSPDGREHHREHLIHINPSVLHLNPRELERGRTLIMISEVANQVAILGYAANLISEQEINRMKREVEKEFEDAMEVKAAGDRGKAWAYQGHYKDEKRSQYMASALRRRIVQHITEKIDEKEKRAIEAEGGGFVRWIVGYDFGSGDATRDQFTLRPGERPNHRERQHHDISEFHSNDGGKTWKVDDGNLVDWIKWENDPGSVHTYPEGKNRIV